MSTRNEKTLAEERVLLLAPTARDGTLSRSILAEAGLQCEAFSRLNELCVELERGAGVVLLTEEALTSGEPIQLFDFLENQPDWSDLPIVSLSKQGADSALAISLVERLGNVTVLEQPVRVSTLVSTLRTAIKARRRQYELRDQVEARALLAAIVESSDDAIISKTLDGTITSWNSGATRIFGYTAEEAIGQPITLIIPPERRDEEKVIVEQLRLGARIEHFETIRMAKSGERLNISLAISPVRDSRGKIIGASKVARNITDRKRSELALQDSEERFRFLAETVPSIVWTAAPDGAITYANKRWFEYCGLTAEENAALRPELVLHPDDFERCTRMWNESLRDGTEYEVEVRNRRYDGIYRWFVTRAVPWRDEQGRISSWFGITTDIHDQKEVQEELREADRRKDEFLATLGHELRNPLAPIKNSLQFLRLSGENHVNGDHAREIIERQVNHLVRLVDDLLEVSRITRGQIELRKESVELAEIISNAVETSKPLIDAARHRFEISLPSKATIVEADPVRLSQVISNLLNNAAKYTDAGGQIWLDARVEGGEAVVSVRDTGVGIPADMLPKVFDMFTQVDCSPGRAQGGLGIGLTLSRSLVRLHGGNLVARSGGLGHGSEFIVSLPLAKSEKEPEAIDAGDESTAPQSSRRILIVDDNADSAESLGLWLRFVGHDVRLVYDGLAAVEAARAFRPQVVVLDIGLPDIDGYQVAKRLRQEPGFDKVLLIALTGYGQDEDRQRCFQAGFDEHLTKPVDPTSLEELLASH
jgi:PAS domain S-box-containing protein